MDTGVVHYCCCQRNSGTDWSVNICGRTHDTHTHVLVLDINAVSAQLRNTHTEINDKFALLEDLWMRRFRRRPLCHWTCGTDKLLSRERKIKQTNRSLLYIRNGMFTVVVSCPYKILRKHVERTHTHTWTQRLRHFALYDAPLPVRKYVCFCLSNDQYCRYSPRQNRIQRCGAMGEWQFCVHFKIKEIVS